MNSMDLYDLVRDGKMSLTEFMRQLDEREMKNWSVGYDTGFKNAKIVFAPAEISSVL